MYLDFKSPYAYIAKDPTRELAAALGIEVDWRPLTLNIPSYLGSARLDSAGKVAESNRSPEQWSGVKYAYKDARRYATLRGLTLRGTTKIWDTSLAHIAFWWAKQQGGEPLARFIDLVYERFWKRELDVEEFDVVLATLREARVATDGFDAYAVGEGREQHDAMQAAIFDAGLFGVPGYVVDGEYFFGREHLPRIANIYDRFVPVRTVNHNVIDEHAAAVNRMHTGRPVSGSVVYPSLGSIVAHERRSAAEGVPPYVLIG
ncbi:MAG: DUF1501 domain-containing protein [Gammaproteobacteria bacterium]|nr:DUF1501 domain-containing protein [Gammaproteobacteria bacterium]